MFLIATEEDYRVVETFRYYIFVLLTQKRTNDYSYSHTRPEEGRWEMRKEGRIGEGKVGQEEDREQCFIGRNSLHVLAPNFCEWHTNV